MRPLPTIKKRLAGLQFGPLPLSSSEKPRIRYNQNYSCVGTARGTSSGLYRCGFKPDQAALFCAPEQKKWHLDNIDPSGMHHRQFSL
jgi:hypothetical protein